ncbi:MAG: pyrimidine-nucleoside phosphorylase [Bacillota bacterium]
MNAVDIINKKRRGEVLSADEIQFMVMGFTDGVIPDYQMSALLMAICLRGMTKEETVILTGVMRDSGETVDLSEIKGIKVDKHSTGGVGDKTTLIVAPIAAACGVPIAKMSGRGLGFTGGTVDKMESIPGFVTSMERDQFIRSVNEKGIAVIGQTGHIAPADKKMYALRDVTGTTESIALITSSIMSKKLAAGADAIVLDVKCGSGAFMKTYEDARELATWMVDIGEGSGKSMTAVISDMEQPLGKAVGNALEVREAIDVLKGGGPEDIRDLSLRLAAEMILLGGRADSREAAEDMALEALDSGKALEIFRQFVANQGGDERITEDENLLPQAAFAVEVRAGEAGYVTGLDAMRIGLASQHSGAGREKKEDEIDMAAGILLEKKTGDEIAAGDLLCTVFGNDKTKAQAGAREARGAYTIGPERPEKPELIKEVID